MLKCFTRVDMSSTQLLCILSHLIVLIATLNVIYATFETSKFTIPDFRYNTARIDGITKLPNETLIIISNGYYWSLNDRHLPRISNVRGRVSTLYPKFKRVNAILTDPYNEMDPKVYLFSTVSTLSLIPFQITFAIVIHIRSHVLEDCPQCVRSSVEIMNQITFSVIYRWISDGDQHWRIWIGGVPSMPPHGGTDPKTKTAGFGLSFRVSIHLLIRTNLTYLQIRRTNFSPVVHNFYEFCYLFKVSLMHFE